MLNEVTDSSETLVSPPLIALATNEFHQIRLRILNKFLQPQTAFSTRGKTHARVSDLFFMTPKKTVPR